MKISSLGWVLVLIFISITIVSSAPAPKPPKPKPAPAPTPPKPKPTPAPTPPKPKPKPAPTPPKPKPAPAPTPPKPKPAPAPTPPKPKPKPAPTPPNPKPTPAPTPPKPKPAPAPAPTPAPKPKPAPKPAPGGEVEDETEFSYETKGNKGPAKWGTLDAEWKMCGIGKMQSPIDLRDKNVVVSNKFGLLRSQYLPSNTTIKNRGHDIMLKFKGGNKGIGVTIRGTRYQLQQLHWHSPSEHTINGKRFALEEHLVHESKDKRYAVVAFLYNLGASDPFLFSLEKQLKKITDTHASEEHIRTVSSKQVKLLRVAVHDASDSNARPLQAVNKRKVYLYKPKVKLMKKYCNISSY
ncbi:Alpha carbonic anhydrase 8 [Arabidopsis thaliana]|uniref:Alpha carbonic anhydrase domain n=1 Tax=Arabidopsis thaliana x Arabidopsis arenosa TaxID=1240361 RepID=A0A8T2D310_9BRAS|nr:alpha carbonic anhydrase 8 [Arabidopsis thaliana]AED96750.1 alpha carbonic anhydrase 8 [Arabidopsis thaliana]KAG7606285.1 Alpha carbonic anhydrase domain [Arabidopsis thaliana x Arabidopsis arenosa]BAB11260.1 unnamed protein product [Arabidopsis thaliana]|eukprot:NP_200444.1 alpha carbonic anhydrase 8 [Arabidopsis thaliana]